VRFALILFVLLAECNRGQVAESDQAVVIERAKALEKAADASVDASISQMTRDAFEDSAENEAASQ
jgi:hypothetical protein